MPVYVKAKVTGDVSIRDAVTREPVQPGGEVTLLVRVPGMPLESCPRHPKRGVNDPKQQCVCHSTLIDPLVEGGLIELTKTEAAKAEKGKG